MGSFEQAGRDLDDDVTDAKRIGRRVARNVRIAGNNASDDVRALLDELDESLRETKDTDVEALRTRVNAQLARARAVLEDAQDNVRDRVQSAIAATEDRFQDRPWETLAAAAGIGFVLGVLVGRR
jgi:ElaB/YqjD/DUF883 family membrane-anchored ribosome-binding protein